MREPISLKVAPSLFQTVIASPRFIGSTNTVDTSKHFMDCTAAGRGTLKEVLIVLFEGSPI